MTNGIFYDIIKYQEKRCSVSNRDYRNGHLINTVINMSCIKLRIHHIARSRTDNSQTILSD